MLPKKEHTVAIVDNHNFSVGFLKKYPQIYVFAFSMEDPEDIHPDIIEGILQEVLEKENYHSEKVKASQIHSLNLTPIHNDLVLKEKELIFLKLACSEMTYKEIAEVMNLSPKTVDGYRHELFQKLQVKNRVGLVMYALKNDLIQL